MCRALDIGGVYIGVLYRALYIEPNVQASIYRTAIHRARIYRTPVQDGPACPRSCTKDFVRPHMQYRRMRCRFRAAPPSRTAVAIIIVTKIKLSDLVTKSLRTRRPLCIYVYIYI